MTNHWIDIKNADAILIMGSNAAEHHPISFKWVLQAKDKGAVVMHVDPKFSRTSARSDFHVPLRSGTDIAFMGGMIHYILETESYFRQYVLDYTNASFIVGESYGFKDGLFSGYDIHTRSYDRSKWNFETDAQGTPKRDPSLKHPRCVFRLMQEHYSRYTLDNVSSVTGVTKENLLKVYKAFAATGKPDKAGTMMYALGWTQHTVGVQNIRSAAIVQLLLGNIGVAGGGINALRGEPNVQGSTDHCLLYHIIPGYMTMPMADWQTYADYNKANTPVSADPQSANWWQHKPKYLTSLLKAWFGDAATAENGYCYGLLPKIEKGADHSYMFLFDRMYSGKITGGFIIGLNPMNSVPNTNKVRKALDNLDWLVTAELHHSETTDNWRRPGVDPATVKTEVFLLPSAHRVEKAGSVSNSGRWLVWHHKAVEPEGEARSFGDMFVPLINVVRDLYRKEGGTMPEAVLNLDWPQQYDPEEWARRVNGFFLKDTTVNGKEYKKGQLVPSFTALADDGSTSSLNWLYSGSYTEEDGNKAQRRDPSQTPMQAAIGLYPKWSWCWPVNRRILYNRASVDAQGKPWNPAKAVISWNGKKWEGDVPDGGWPPMATGKGRHPFIMSKHGFGQLYGTGRMDGPFSEHYEPVETPIDAHPFSKQLSSPVYKFVSSDMDKLARPADPRFPYVLTTYNVTEHWCGGGETRNVPNLLEAEPQLYVELSPELAEEKGIANGDGVILESARGRVEAIAMVTVRIRPFTVQGKTVHLVGMPFCFGWTTPGTGDSTNRLTPSVGDPNTSIPEYKASCVNIRKADTLTEIDR
jgi:formate dehydrogenase major subunit